MDIVDFNKSGVEFICSMNFNDSDVWKLKTVDTVSGRKAAYFTYDKKLGKFRLDENSEFKDDARKYLILYLVERHQKEYLACIYEYKLRFKYMGEDDLDYDKIMEASPED